ncbi:hypothetical protein L1887_32049 [Cichorium endivia]|nr:hypothetical protein L1887_32049 [Cichorium endivia]
MWGRPSDYCAQYPIGKLYFSRAEMTHDSTPPQGVTTRSGKWSPQTWPMDNLGQAAKQPLGHDGLRNRTSDKPVKADNQQKKRLRDETYGSKKKSKVIQQQLSPHPSDALIGKDGTPIVKVVKHSLTSSTDPYLKSINTVVEKVHLEVVSLRKEISSLRSMIKDLQRVPSDS